VLLFTDTFMNYHYPSVGVAATTLLEPMGYEVLLAPHGCCGRPMISKGMLARVKESARRNVDVLYPYAEQGIPIVGCEPSCLLTLRDEYPDLLPGDTKAKAVAQRSLLLDEFLAKAAEGDGLGLAFKPANGKVLFHGHCHQKALVGTEASAKVLSLVPGLKVEVLDAGCCGMAGAFGYEKEHYYISMKIGESRLFPVVRANPEATLVVMGVSCRQQVEHGTGVRALHLAEFLASALRDDSQGCDRIGLP
jgi:Fe-S oxidoreductase